MEAGVPLGIGKNSVSLYMPFLTAGNALLALAESMVGRTGRLRRTDRGSSISPHTYDLVGRTVRGGIVKESCHQEERGREEAAPWTSNAYHGR